MQRDSKDVVTTSPQNQMILDKNIEIIIIYENRPYLHSNLNKYRLRNHWGKVRDSTENIFDKYYLKLLKSSRFMSSVSNTASSRDGVNRMRVISLFLMKLASKGGSYITVSGMT